MEERDIMISRLGDLAKRRDEGNYCTFSPFLSPDLFGDAKAKGNALLSGGYDEAERCVAAFLPDYMSEEDVSWPISLIIISPTDGKMHSHRDYLGSLMSLGIKRQVLGDIIVDGAKAYLFCLDTIEEFILNNLTHVGGAVCKTEKAESFDILPERKFEDAGGTTSSERLDCIVALATRLSRTKAAEFITGGNVTVGGRETTKTTYTMKPGDRFSVRGKGKFIYDGAQGTTRKGRTVVKIRKYI